MNVSQMISVNSFSRTLILDPVEFLAMLIRDGFIILPDSADHGPISVGRQTAGSPFAVWVVNRHYEFEDSQGAARFALRHLTPGELVRATDKALWMA